MDAHGFTTNAVPTRISLFVEGVCRVQHADQVSTQCFDGETELVVPDFSWDGGITWVPQ